MPPYEILFTESPETKVTSVHISIDPAAVRTYAAPSGTIVEMESAWSAGAVGGPGLPSFTIHLALPPLVNITGVETRVIETAALLAEPVHVAPMQPPRHAGRVVRHETLERSLDPRPVPPNPDLYERAIREPRPAARVLRLDRSELLSTAVVEVNPVRLTADRRLELRSKMELQIRYEALRGRKREPITRGRVTVRSREQARRVAELARASVINPRTVDSFLAKAPFPPLRTGVDYLIITDNHTWDAGAIAPIAGVGDLRRAFERLAEWKRMRGLKAKVITISELVNGLVVRDDGTPFTVCGNGVPAMDLQEVIRNAVKYAYATWHVAWVLLGGDTTIVPSRQAHGAGWGDGIDIPKGNIDLPLTGSSASRSFWTGAFLKIQTDVAPDSSRPLSAHVVLNTGQFLAYDPTGSAPKSWCYADSKYNPTSSIPTTQPVLMRVNWPASDVGSLANLKWIPAWANQPSDLYYASVTGAKYDEPGKHDWYLLEDGLVGKYTNSWDPDGINLAADLSVGRAPVDSESEAAVFVSKVISYERYRDANGTLSRCTDWPRQCALLATTWVERKYMTRSYASAAANIPEGTYYHANGSDHTVLHMDDAMSNYRLFAALSDDDLRLITYDPNAASTRNGWFFASDATGVVPSIDSNGQAAPTKWIVVFFPQVDAPELTAPRFVFDDCRPDGAMEEAETVRKTLATACPQIDLFARLYEDEVDLTGPDRQAAPVDYITSADVQKLLSDGAPQLTFGSPHWVNIIGHGNQTATLSPGGRLGSELTSTDAAALKNGPYTFIANACSCLTGDFETNCLGTSLLTNPSGGAVAYIGHSDLAHMGFSRVFQQAFFAALQQARHLGVLADTRISVCHADLPGLFTLNLLGDPEMPVWIGKPRVLEASLGRVIRVPATGTTRKKITVIVTCAGAPVQGANVSVSYQGTVTTRTTASDGSCSLIVAPTGTGKIEVVISAPGYVPYLASVQVYKSPRKPKSAKPKRPKHPKETRARGAAAHRHAPKKSRAVR